MTNWEFYEDKIIKIMKEEGVSCAVSKKTGEPFACGTLEVNCKECIFNEKIGESCKTARAEWFAEEHQEVDWTKVKVDTPIYVTNTKDKNWRPRHFAKFEDGKVYAFLHGTTSWSAEDIDYCVNWRYAKLAEVE